jgi:hypothetical protein
MRHPFLTVRNVPRRIVVSPVFNVQDLDRGDFREPRGAGGAGSDGIEDEP